MNILKMLHQRHQHHRLLRLSFPHDDAPSAPLMIHRFSGHESMSRDFCFTLELLSDDATIALESMQGKLLCVSLVLADGRLRPFTGYVSRFAFVKTDGAIAFYEAILVPWLHYARLRRNSRLFHQQTIEQQTHAILKAYSGLPRWRWSVVRKPLQYTMCTQWDESDHNYLSRRWAAEGYAYWYEHAEDGHTLVVSDDTCGARPLDEDGAEIRFHSKGGAQDEDAIAQWRATRQAVPAHSVVTGFDFKQPYPRETEIRTIVQQGATARVEEHRYLGHYGFRNLADAERLVRLRMEELEARTLQFEASGNNRHVTPGRSFRLREHFRHGKEDGQFLILEVHHEACNNYLQGADMEAHYSNRFVCQPLDSPWRPGPGFDSVDTRIATLQTATVVGPKGKGSLNVDRYGRIEVRFHWDREQTSSCWVRVATNWAGSRSGLATHPRVDSEVVVQWLDGNPDHPLVTACVHNEANMPPWELPQQRALTGLRSRELTPEGGNRALGRSNHLVLDDTWKQIQIQLKSDHQSSQLSLGHITRIDDHAGRKDGRGQGFELRTDGHGAVRAQRGLLLTTEARPGAEGHITDMTETVARMEQGADLHDSLSQAALQSGAQQDGDQRQVAAELHQQNDAVKGRVVGDENGFPEFQQPHLTLSSPAGIQTSSAGSTHLLSHQHTALTSGAHASISAGKSLLASARDAVRLFACKAGMKLVAAAADIDITALRDSINILAKLNITHTANRISITAKEEVLINGGGSYMRFNAGGIEQGTSGNWQAHAAQYNLDGPANGPQVSLPEPVKLEELKQKQSLAFLLRSHSMPGRIFAHEPYALYKDGAKVADGMTDGRGQLVVKDHVSGTTDYVVKLSNGHEFELPVKAALDSEDDILAARGYRAADEDVQDRQRNREFREG